MFKGSDTAALAAHRKVELGMALIPEGRLIFADQTVYDNLILGAYTRWNRDRAQVLLEFEQIYELFPRIRERLHQHAGSLSGGEQQMLAIARGLLSKPDLLMIDELSLGLAPKIVEQLMMLLRDLNAKGQTILLVEQLASYALAIADEAYVIGHGKVEIHGNAKVLARSPEVMAAFLGKKRKPDQTTKGD
jgi:branched-chain amino acid transport system ATP-binding protein